VLPQPRVDVGPTAQTRDLRRKGFILAEAHSTNFVCAGARDSLLAKSALPTELVSWTPTSSRSMVGVDTGGRLHSLAWGRDKWELVDYIEGFVAGSALVVCTYLETASQVLVFTGDTVEGISIGADHKFRDRLKVNLACKYDAADAITNRLGQCIARSANSQCVLSAQGKALELGPIHPKAPFAIAESAPIVALVSPDLRLSACSIQSGKLRRTAPAQSPQLPAPPQSLVWARWGASVLATFEDETWAVYRPLALSN